MATLNTEGVDGKRAYGADRLQEPTMSMRGSSNVGWVEMAIMVMGAILTVFGAIVFFAVMSVCKIVEKIVKLIIKDE
jgi:hypothetical protein